MPVSSNSAKPLPVTVVSGYLGAGKTTLVNSILSGDHSLRIAVLVNDFGKIAIDEKLIGARDGDVIALANGCMCCQIGGDLYDAIDRILRMRERFDHLVIETSGVADPEKIAQIAVAEPDLELSRTVVLVDTVNFSNTLADPRLRDTLLRQIRSADLILLTKIDAASAAKVADFQTLLGDLGLSVPIAVLQKTDCLAWRILKERGMTRSIFRKAGALKPHVLPFESWSWTGAEQVHLDRLMAFARDPALSIYRLKGRFRLTDGRTILIHKVGSEIAVESEIGTSETSEFVAIGTKPAFNTHRTDDAWTKTIRDSNVRGP
ncbi:MAG: GTP-binding protein [Proteobacteria bacterium]|nr:GTP-binding protein [Pseudomonadota bacterium]